MSYIIKKTSVPIIWDNIPVLPIDNVLWRAYCGVRAQCQLCYDEETLFVHLSAAEKAIRAEYTEPLSPVHEDSCLEFFFRLPGSGNYFNFEINPNGAMCLQYGPRRGDRINIVRKDEKEYFNLHTAKTPDGWEVFYQIPLKFIQLFTPDYRFGGELSANFYKCGDKTPNPHFLAWNPIPLEKPDFHCPQYFGKLIFE